MNTLQFDEATKSAVIDLPTLDRTIKFETYSGAKFASRPLAHSDMIKRIIEVGNTYSDFEATVAPIVVRHDRCQRQMWKGEKDACPIENYHVERIVTKVEFKDAAITGDDIGTVGCMGVALSYNERGIQMAFGHNVSFCQNMNIFGERLFSTYGSDKIPFEKGMQLLQHWMQNFNENMEETHNYIDILKKRVITAKERYEVIGKMYEMAIASNLNQNISAPLNVTECNKMVAACIDGHYSNGAFANDAIVTAWDFTNACTSVLKPSTSDMVTLLSKNSQLNSYLIKEFGV